MNTPNEGLPPSDSESQAGLRPEPMALATGLDSPTTDPSAPDVGIPDSNLPESETTPVIKRMEFEVDQESSGQRVDFYVSMKCDGYSRMFLRAVFVAGKVQVDGRSVKPAFHVQTGQKISIELPPIPNDGPIPEDIPLDILFEDDHLVIINKPAGMVVHPAKGHWNGTLTSALAFHFQNLSSAGGPTRPGIVHRLDRDTTGVIAIAKSNEVHYKLSAQFEAREVSKEYHAIVIGSLELDRDWIRAPIGHHPYQRDKMAIRAGHESSRDAETFYEVIKRFIGYSYVRVLPKTGRTHQIRIHLSHIGCPVLADRLYAGHAKATRGQLLRKHSLGLPHHPSDDDIVISRQALHAHKLAFIHPITGEAMTFVSPIAPDMQETLNILSQQSRS